MVVKAYMWPGGNPDREYFMGAATFALEEIESDGKRAYKVTLLKNPNFGGPVESELAEHYDNPRKIWRQGRIRGHAYPQRGAWDLIGGALREMLGSRLRDYKRR